MMKCYGSGRDFSWYVGWSAKQNRHNEELHWQRTPTLDDGYANIPCVQSEKNPTIASHCDLFLIPYCLGCKLDFYLEWLGNAPASCPPDDVGLDDKPGQFDTRYSVPECSSRRRSSCLKFIFIFMFARVPCACYFFIDWSGAKSCDARRYATKSEMKKSADWELLVPNRHHLVRRRFENDCVFRIFPQNTR